MSKALLILPAVLLLAACKPASEAPADAAVEAPAAASPSAAAPAPATDTATVTSAAGHAELKATAGHTVAGHLRFAAVDGGIRVTGDVTGLPGGGTHGFHVHENGDCSAPDASSAGGHFNPGASDHGRVGQGAHHGGDSDNIVANDQGVATVDTLLQGVTLGDGAATDIIGRGVIVHADADDYVTQPTGNAGARLACGVIAAE